METFMDLIQYDYFPILKKANFAMIYTEKDDIETQG